MSQPIERDHNVDDFINDVSHDRLFNVMFEFIDTISYTTFCEWIKEHKEYSRWLGNTKATESEYMNH